MKRLIELFTDEGDIVIDPCAGSGTTLIASRELNRNSYGFEVGKEQFKKSIEFIKNYKSEENIEMEDLF